MENKPNVVADIHIHVMDAESFEIMDVALPEIEKRKGQLEEQLYGQKPTDENKRLYDELCTLDVLSEQMASELSECGDTMKGIHDELWQATPEDMGYTIHLEMNYACTPDGIDDVNVEISDLHYEVTGKEKVREVADYDDR